MSHWRDGSTDYSDMHQHVQVNEDQHLHKMNLVASPILHRGSANVVPSSMVNASQHSVIHLHTPAIVARSASMHSGDLVYATGEPHQQMVIRQSRIVQQQDAYDYPQMQQLPQQQQQVYPSQNVHQNSNHMMHHAQGAAPVAMHVNQLQINCGGLRAVQPASSNEVGAAEVGESNGESSSSNAQVQVASSTEPVPLLPPGYVLRRRWRVGQRLGYGGFGEVYLAVNADPFGSISRTTDDTTSPWIPGNDVYIAEKAPSPRDTGVEVAIKVEDMASRQTPRNVLKMEAYALKKLQGSGAFPRYFEYAVDRPKRYYLVQSVLGENLGTLRKYVRGYVFSSQTVLRIAIQMLFAIEKVHAVGLIHRDIKPSNFCIGHVRQGRDAVRSLHLIDFGIARIYSQKGEIIQQRRKVCGFRGTPRYASLNVHRYLDTGPVDDLWSIFYVLYEISYGYLPWVRCSDKAEIMKFKEAYLESGLLSNLSPDIRGPMWFFHDNLRQLDFFSVPDYAAIRRSFASSLLSLMQREGIMEYDWESLPHENLTTFPKLSPLDQKAKDIIPPVLDELVRNLLYEVAEKNHIRPFPELKLLQQQAKQNASSEDALESHSQRISPTDLQHSSYASNISTASPKINNTPHMIHPTACTQPGDITRQESGQMSLANDRAQIDAMSAASNAFIKEYSEPNQKKMLASFQNEAVHPMHMSSRKVSNFEDRRSENCNGIAPVQAFSPDALAQIQNIKGRDGSSAGSNVIHEVDSESERNQLHMSTNSASNALGTSPSQSGSASLTNTGGIRGISPTLQQRRTGVQLTQRMQLQHAPQNESPRSGPSGMSHNSLQYGEPILNLTLPIPVDATPFGAGTATVRNLQEYQCFSPNGEIATPHSSRGLVSNSPRWVHPSPTISATLSQHAPHRLNLLIPEAKLGECASQQGGLSQGISPLQAARVLSRSGFDGGGNGGPPSSRTAASPNTPFSIGAGRTPTGQAFTGSPSLGERHLQRRGAIILKPPSLAASSSAHGEASMSLGPSAVVSPQYNQKEVEMYQLPPSSTRQISNDGFNSTQRISRAYVPQNHHIGNQNGILNPNTPPASHLESISHNQSSSQSYSRGEKGEGNFGERGATESENSDLIKTGSNTVNAWKLSTNASEREDDLEERDEISTREEEQSACAAVDDNPNEDAWPLQHSAAPVLLPTALCQSDAMDNSEINVHRTRSNSSNSHYSQKSNRKSTISAGVKVVTQTNKPRVASSKIHVDIYVRNVSGDKSHNKPPNEEVPRITSQYDGAEQGEMVNDMAANDGLDELSESSGKSKESLRGQEHQKHIRTSSLSSVRLRPFTGYKSPYTSASPVQNSPIFGAVSQTHFRKISTTGMPAPPIPSPNGTNVLPTSSPQAASTLAAGYSVSSPNLSTSSTFNSPTLSAQLGASSVSPKAQYSSISSEQAKKSRLNNTMPISSQGYFIPTAIPSKSALLPTHNYAVETVSDTLRTAIGKFADKYLEGQNVKE